MKTNQSQTAPAEVRENIMGTMEINPLLLKLSIPMMISMLVQALYNVVDSVFVSHVSESALTAVSLAFSLQNVMIAVGVGTGVGVNALLSKSLGEKNQSRANATAENGIFLSLCSFAVFFVIGLTCMKPYFYAQTSDAVIAQQGIQYLSVCCIFSLGIFTQTMGEKLLAATGRTQLSMISQLVGAVVNIILDPIFIFGYCGQALSGTTGAAVATVIGQFCGAGMTLYFNTRKNPDIQISFKGFRPSAKAIGRIYTVGLPSIAMQCVGSLMTFGMNLILMAFSATAVAVFGVYFKLQSFVFMPIFGLNNGMVPIIGYNYGARRPDRVKKTIKLAVCYAEGIMLAGFCIFQFAPGLVLSIFAASDAMLAIGIPAMRIICLHFLLAGVSIVLSSVFQALGNGVFSLIVSVCRQLFVLLPAAWLLAQTGSVNNVWWAFLIAEVVSILMSLAFYARINKPSHPCTTDPGAGNGSANERNVISMVKKLKWNLILMSLLYVGLGIFLVMKPGTALNIVCYALGGVVLACAAVQLIRYFVVERGVFQSQLTLISGLVCLALGVFLLLRSDIVVSILPIVFGLFVIFDAIGRVQNALDLRRCGYDSWKGFLLLPVLSVVLGVILIANPFGAMETLVMAIGVILIVEGAINLLSALYTVLAVRRFAKLHPETQSVLESITGEDLNGDGVVAPDVAHADAEATAVELDHVDESATVEQEERE